MSFLMLLEPRNRMSVTLYREDLLDALFAARGWCSVVQLGAAYEALAEVEPAWRQPGASELEMFNFAVDVGDPEAGDAPPDGTAAGRLATLTWQERGAHGQGILWAAVHADRDEGLERVELALAPVVERLSLGLAHQLDHDAPVTAAAMRRHRDEERRQDARAAMRELDAELRHEPPAEVQEPRAPVDWVAPGEEEAVLRRLVDERWSFVEVRGYAGDTDSLSDDFSQVDEEEHLPANRHVAFVFTHPRLSGEDLRRDVEFLAINLGYGYPDDKDARDARELEQMEEWIDQKQAAEQSRLVRAVEKVAAQLEDDPDIDPEELRALAQLVAMTHGEDDGDDDGDAVDWMDDDDDHGLVSRIVVLPGDFPEAFRRWQCCQPWRLDLMNEYWARPQRERQGRAPWHWEIWQGTFRDPWATPE